MGKTKRRVPVSKKIEVWQRDRWLCKYCGIKCLREQATIDHIVPLVKGGSNEMENLVTACRDCNHKKGLTEQLIIY